MLRHHVGYNTLLSFVHHVGLCCMMLVYVAFSLPNICQHFFCSLVTVEPGGCIPTLSLLFCNVLVEFPSSLIKPFILVYVTGSIFKMAEKNSNNDLFSRFPSSVFIECHNGGRAW